MDLFEWTANTVPQISDGNYPWISGKRSFELWKELRS